jgi:hypothetical protein
MTSTKDTDVLFSRGPVSDPFGKCVARMDIQMPEQLHDAVITLGQFEQPRAKTKSEYARNALERFVFGEWAVTQALMRRPGEPPSDPTGAVLDDALTALSMMAGIPRDEFIRELLARSVFGEMSMLQSLTAERSQAHQRNAG